MRGGRRKRDGGTRVFFASDLHGSDYGWRKFVNAAEFYDVDVLVFGGDLMGKLLVPIVRENGSYRAHHAGEDHEFGDDGLPKFTAWLARTGSYWRVMDREAYEHAKAVPLAQEELFRDAARERLSAWLELAEERLAGTQVRLFLTGGNDDEPGVLELMEEHRSDRVVPCEGSVVDLDGEHTMITVGWSSPTPWDTWREAREDDLAAMIDEQAATVPDQGRCVFNLHCPPKDTPLDTCVALRAPDGEGSGELPEPIRIGARFQWTGGGSTAVREALRRYQPLVGLHGHIHESPGRFRMGRTQCFNPGSEYAQGQLRGWILTLRHGSLGVYQHTAG